MEEKRVNMITLLDEESKPQEKSAEEKEYLVLLVGYDDDKDEFRDFEFITGREAVYKYIRDRVEVIDLYESKILVETDTLENMKPVIRFMLYVINNNLIDDPGFDITDYMKGDYDYDKDE